jgi:hypothetical protein
MLHRAFKKTDEQRECLRCGMQFELTSTRVYYGWRWGGFNGC